MDAQRYPLVEPVELYGLRWHAELNLRYVKSALDMDEVTGKSVSTVRRELLAGLLAYNVLRGFMVQAACREGASPLSLSFPQCWRRVWQALAFGLRAPQTEQERVCKVERLLVRLLRCELPARPVFRIEPRAVRRRPAV